MSQGITTGWKMLVENRTRDCSEPRESGGSSPKRETMVRTTTRKRAGIIATRETVKSVSVPRTSRIIIFIFPAILKYVLKTYIGVIRRCATCIMGMMGVFKWLRKDIVQRDRNRRSLTPKINGLNNDAYRNALQAFIDRRRNPNESGCVISSNSPDKERLDFFVKKNYENDQKKKNEKRENRIAIPGIPHVKASEIFEIGWVAGTEDRYMELIFAEWHNTRVSLRRHTHRDCLNAVKADLEVLTEIRHPNVLLLMATTHTDEHGLVAIFEPIDCTLYNFVHEQGERVSVQGIAKCAGNLAGALKHAHMRGYVHGAISSHCVFLATCGTVKLGGWELASSLNSPKIMREYEERLRFEIFRWQAPEIFKGQNPSKESDIYGLTLLMWEMCTMNVPWNGLNKSEVERQYVQWERGVITDLYNFPPLLNNLLDAGLQLDVSKRTLDMSRMRRFLQTLEIQYEDAEPLYVETSTNNNNNPTKGVSSSAPSSTSPSSNSSSAKRYPSVETPKRFSERKNVQKEDCPARLLNMNLIEEPKQTELGDLLSFSRNETASVDMFERFIRPTRIQRVNARNVNKTRSNEKLTVTEEKHPKTIESRGNSPLEDTISIAPTDLAHSLDSSDDETSYNDTRVNIKKLRQHLASKREKFFYGSDLSQFSPPDNSNDHKFAHSITKSQMLTQVRSKDYEPHKPASHKTSFEPKQTKSPGQYNNAGSTRMASHQSQKSPYSKVPSAVRNAVIHPKVLNSDSESFFESSLWKKEKMICISKMRKNSPNDSTFFISRYLPNGDASVFDKNESAASNETYTIDVTRETANDELHPNDCMTDLSASTIPRSKSLQALKDALERATDIVQSTTPHQETSIASLPIKNQQSFDNNSNTSRTNESLFEDLYELKHDEPDSEIKSIERSINGDETFFPIEQKFDTKEKISDDKAEYAVRRRCITREETQRGSFDFSRLSSVVCESIAESLNENESSSTDSKPDDRTVILSQPTLNPERVPERSATFELANDETGEQEKQQDSETSFALMVFNDKNRGCHSCNPKSNLARRRSLPAALGQLRNLSNVSLGKLPIRKVDVPDNTVEDIYIDDEFGDCLNCNMLLLDGDATPEDEDFLPDLLELSNSQEYP